ncbi:MAG: metallophosphoesterase [Lentisphaerae bacterium]|nr:metallophosphoesterase [Lentisphaerota bacterium]
MILSNALVLLLLIGGYAFTGRAQTGPPLVVEEPAASLSVILGRPTDRSIALSVLSATDVDARVAYGAELGTFSTTTDVHTLKAGVPSEFELAVLKPDTRYYYHLAGRSPKPLAEGLFHTQRAAGSAFTFALQGDSHPERQGKMFDPALYARTLHNVAKDLPDFYITMGDDFSIERLIERQTLGQAAVDQVYDWQRDFLGPVGHSSALFLVNGNHEQAARCNLDGTATNCAVFAGRARTKFYSLPAPDGFYTGDAEPVQHIGLLRDYYAWTWGDALFVVIDPYWHSPVAVDNKAGTRQHDKGNRQGGTLGDAQYRWLTKTLTESKARWKFVFAHHVNGTGRGGIECASRGEWGTKIHSLFVKTGVTIFFQGHDHLFARQELDGVVYQSCPNPADPTYQAFNRDAYRCGDILPNSGHLRVTVSVQEVAVDYVRSWLAQDETDVRKNGETAFRYTIRTKEPAP